tara:strand:- start:16552 stop:18111 length:1560 start_codon:yes stop_codon:yes gene_type:complete
MRSRLKRVGLALIFLGVFVSVGLTHRAKTIDPELFSSPTESRKTRGYKDGWLDLLEPTKQRRESGQSALEPMRLPKVIPGISDEFVLDYSAEAKITKTKLPNRWAKGLSGNEKIELVAFATWFPTPSDDYRNPDWKIEGSFRDAKSLGALDEAALNELGVPNEFRTFRAPEVYKTPKIRLLFRTAGIQHPRFLSIMGGSPITGAEVTYEINKIDDGQPNSESMGEWTFFDMALLAWHDTPIQFYLKTLTGEPQQAILENRPGAEVVFEDRLRIQWLAEVNGEVDVETYLYNFKPQDPAPKLEKELERLESKGQALLIEADKEPGWTPSILVRASNINFLEDHCGWKNPDGSLNFGWNGEGSQNDIILASRAKPADLNQPMELVFIPQITELSFEISGMPDAPNPSTITNLFDVVMSRLTLADEISTSEGHILGFIGTATQLAWDNESRWGDHPPKSLPPDHTFEGKTAKELLHWYLRSTPGATLRYDEAEKVLYINEDKTTWLERIEEWWDEHRPGWTY